MENTSEIRTGPVTRTEILDAVDHAFDAGTPLRDDLITAAIASDARPPVIDVLRGLPAQSYAKRSDLWTHLPEIPVE